MNLNINKTDEARCCCGRLLAVRVPGGLEIRCSRCKSTYILTLGPGGAPSTKTDGETRS